VVDVRSRVHHGVIKAIEDLRRERSRRACRRLFTGADLAGPYGLRQMHVAVQEPRRLAQRQRPGRRWRPTGCVSSGRPGCLSRQRETLLQAKDARRGGLRRDDALPAWLRPEEEYARPRPSLLRKRGNIAPRVSYGRHASRGRGRIRQGRACAAAIKLSTAAWSSTPWKPRAATGLYDQSSGRFILRMRPRRACWLRRQHGRHSQGRAEAGAAY